MKNGLACIVIGLLGLLMTGCSIPRAIRLDALAQDIPTPAHTIETYHRSIDPVGPENFPSASAKFKCDGNMGEIWRAYKATLVEQGWRELPYENEYKSDSYYIAWFTRYDCYLYLHTWRHEEEQTFDVEIEIVLAFNPIEWLCIIPRNYMHVISEISERIFGRKCEILPYLF